MIMSWGQVRARRMVRHGLGSAGCDGVVAAARAMCGAHAQIMSAAELSLGIRLPRCQPVRRPRRRCGRTRRWSRRTARAGRCTCCLPRICHCGWPRSRAVPHQVAVPDTMAMTEDQTEAVIKAIGDAVAEAGDRGLTIAELSEQVPARAGSWAGDLVMPAFQQMWPRWRQSLTAAAHRGAVIFGPDRGRLVTYRSPGRPAVRAAAAGGIAGPGLATPRLSPQLRSGSAAGLRPVAGRPRALGRAALRRNLGRARRGRVRRRTAYVVRGDTGMCRRPDGQRTTAPLFRRLRRRQPSARTALSRQGSRAGAQPQRAGRQLPDAADRRRGGRGLAREAHRIHDRDHRGAAARAHYERSGPPWTSRPIGSDSSAKPNPA